MLFFFPLLFFLVDGGNQTKLYTNYAHVIEQTNYIKAFISWLGLLFYINFIICLFKKKERKKILPWSSSWTMLNSSAEYIYIYIYDTFFKIDYLKLRTIQMCHQSIIYITSISNPSQRHFYGSHNLDNKNL